MGEAQDDVQPDNDKFDAGGNPTANWKGAEHAARFAVRLMRAIKKKAIVVPEPKAVKRKMREAATALSAYRYSGDIDHFDDETFNLTDEELAAFDAPPARVKMIRRMRHPIRGRKEDRAAKQAQAEYDKTIADLKAFINSEKLRIANELKGRGSPGGEPPTGNHRIGLVYQARAAKMAAELLDREDYQGAQRMVQALLYFDTMSKLGRLEAPQEAPEIEGIIQSAKPRDASEPLDDQARKEADQYLEDALAKRGMPDDKPTRDRARAYLNVARGQLQETEQLFAAAALLQGKDPDKLRALLKDIRPRFDEFEDALKLSKNLELPDDVGLANARIDAHEGRLNTIERMIRQSDNDLDAARNYYAEHSVIRKELQDLLFGNVVKKRDGDVRIEGAALTGTGKIKGKKRSFPQGPLKEIVAKYQTVKALEEVADHSGDADNLVDKMLDEVEAQVKFLTDNQRTYDDIEKLFGKVDDELARKRWKYDVQTKADHEDSLEKIRDELDKARTTDDLNDKVKTPLEVLLQLLEKTDVPEAGHRRTRAKTLRDRLDAFEKEYLKPLSEALHDYGEMFDVAARSARETVEHYAKGMQDRGDAKASDEKRLRKAAKQAEKDSTYKGKYEIEFQNIRSGADLGKDETVKAQAALLDDLQKRVTDRAQAIRDEIKKGVDADDLDADIREQVQADLRYSEYEAGRIATIEPLLKNRAKWLKKRLKANKDYAPIELKATFESLLVRLKSVEARRKSAQSSEDLNALWAELQGIERERVASGGAQSIQDETDVPKIVAHVVNAEKSFCAAIRKFFDDEIAPVGRDAKKKADAEEVDPDFNLLAAYCTPSSPMSAMAIIDKFVEKLPDVLESQNLEALSKSLAAKFKGSDAERREAKEKLLSDLRWRREIIANSAHGKKLRYNPFENGDHANSYLRVLQAAEGQIMAKVK